MLGASERRARSVLLDEYCRSTGLELKYAIKVLGREAPAGAGEEILPALERGLHGVGCEGAQGCVDGSGAAVWQTVFRGNPGVVAGFLGAASRRTGGGRAETDSEDQRGADRSGACPVSEQGAEARCGERNTGGHAAGDRGEVRVVVGDSAWGAGDQYGDAVRGSMSGAIVWGLDATDIYSGGTEMRAVWNRGGQANSSKTPRSSIPRSGPPCRPR